jgi:hypothetical protein
VAQGTLSKVLMCLCFDQKMRLQPRAHDGLCNGKESTQFVYNEKKEWIVSLPKSIQARTNKALVDNIRSYTRPHGDISRIKCQIWICIAGLGEGAHLLSLLLARVVARLELKSDLLKHKFIY